MAGLARATAARADLRGSRNGVGAGGELGSVGAAGAVVHLRVPTSNPDCGRGRQHPGEGDLPRHRNLWTPLLARDNQAPPVTGSRQPYLKRMALSHGVILSGLTALFDTHILAPAEGFICLTAPTYPRVGETSALMQALQQHPHSESGPHEEPPERGLHHHRGNSIEAVRSRLGQRSLAPRRATSTPVPSPFTTARLQPREPSASTSLIALAARRNAGSTRDDSPGVSRTAGAWTATQRLDCP